MGAKPLTNKEKQARLRERRAKAGLKQRQYYLTDAEHEKVKAFIKAMRDRT